MSEIPQAPKEFGKFEAWRLLAPAFAMFRRTWRALVITGLLFKVVAFGLAAAGSAIVLSWVMAETGRSAVTNTDIASLLLGPWGVLIVLVALSGTVFLTLAEQAALMVVATVTYLRPGLSLGRLVRIIGVAVFRIARLAVILVGVTLAVVLPVVAAIGVVYRAVLGGHDINYYLSARPPAFLAVGALGAVLALAGAAVLATLYVRWIVSLPIVLFEAHRPVEALSASRARVRGHGWGIFLLIGGWQLANLLLGVLFFRGFRLLAAFAFGQAGSSTAAALATVALLVVLHACGAAVGSFISSVGRALIVLRTHIALGLRAGVLTEERVTPPEAIGEGAPTSPARLVAAVAALFIAAAVGVAIFLAGRLAAVGHTEITAHRGYSRVAPENTLSAIRKAIEVGADWAEIDAQETKDGVVVILHDRDLMRLGGDPRRLSDLTFEELRTIDVGRKFSAAYTGERVPTLDETIALARGKIRLNIELKYYGDDPRLARDVARIIHERGFESQCFVASLAYGSLQEARKADPQLKTAAIVAARAGDITRLDADLLSVNASLVSFRLLRDARTQGKPLHVWTIDDERSATILMGRGVANIITNDPEGMIRVRKEWEARSPAQKLLVVFRDVLGLAEKRAAPEPRSDAEL
jgi:glycerophosphoryl diester phosphodiesterase